VCDASGLSDDHDMFIMWVTQHFLKMWMVMFG